MKTTGDESDRVRHKRLWKDWDKARGVRREGERTKAPVFSLFPSLPAAPPSLSVKNLHYGKTRFKMRIIEYTRFILFFVIADKLTVFYLQLFHAQFENILSLRF